jgi:hypothetical protein
VSTSTEEKSTLHIMSKEGDTRIMWDPRIPAEVAAAKAAFDAAKTGGMLAYTVDPNSGEKTGTVIREFDETAGKIIMSPQLVGG